MMAGAFSRMRVGFAAFLALAGQTPALAQPFVADDLAVDQQELGPASMLPDIAKMSPTEVRGANAGIRAGIERAFRERGVSVAPAELSVSSVVVNVAGQGVVKTTVRAPSRFYYQYTGRAKGKAVFVICVSRSGRQFEPSGTECERRVNAVFGPGERG